MKNEQPGSDAEHTAVIGVLVRLFWDDEPDDLAPEDQRRVARVGRRLLDLARYGPS